MSLQVQSWHIAKLFVPNILLISNTQRSQNGRIKLHIVIEPSKLYRESSTEREPWRMLASRGHAFSGEEKAW